MLTNRRRNALAFCSSLAIATALAAAPQAASAQSFQGNSTVVAGSATVTTGSNTTTVDVGSSQAVINWTPFDTATSTGTPITFQPAGTTATFQSTSNFAVLNRILPADASRPVVFNGNVISQIQGTTTTPGGTVFFYSPGGILVGSNAVFDVGNLGLTTLDPFVDGNGNWYNGNQVQFQQGDPHSNISVQAGAQLTASQSNSYIALVAPVVQNFGNIEVNGSAALVVAEAATITFSPDGLFDIQVTVGSSGQTVQNLAALYNSGTITGPAGTAGSDNHRIYMVAVPKNDALTQILIQGGTLGFDVAAAADVSGNSIILSSGRDIVAGQIAAAPSSGGSTTGSSISSGNSHYTSTVIASGTDFVDFSANGSSGTGTSSFASNLSAHSDSQVDVNAYHAGSLTIAGNLILDADAVTPGAGQSVTAGLAFIGSQENSVVSIAGDAVIRATAQGGNATGGVANIYLDTGGSLAVGGALRLRTEGLSGTGGNAHGGLSRVFMTGGSSLVANELNVTADAVSADTTSSLAPGSATGGTATITVDGAGTTLTVQAGNSSGGEEFGDFALLSAQAFGGASSAPGGVGGAAQGGNATFQVTSGGVANLPVDPGAANFIRMFARAYGGDTFANGGTGGAATGGNVSININGGTLNSGNLLLPSSFAQGGSADASVTGVANGGNAVGGTRNVTIINGTLNGSFAGGGPGAGGGNGSLLGTGGNGTGGTANFFMNNGTINATTDAYGISRVIAFTQNAGGTGAIGGSASGGVTNVTIQNGSTITVNPDSNGVGGVVNFNSFNSTPDLTSDGAIASGDATAGTVNVSIVNSQINAADFAVYANAASGWIASTGGAGANAHIGNATGGTATLNLTGATIAANSMSVGALGDAGNSEDSGTVDGGNGTGGIARVFGSGSASTITVGELIIDASGTGSTIFGGPGNGGNGTGGRALLDANNGGSLTITGSTTVSAGGYGHSAQTLGRGGDGSAGFAEVSAVTGGTLVLNGDLEITTSAEGGDGTVAGSATAQVQTIPGDVIPNALLYARHGSVTVSGLTTIGSDSLGGAGFAGATGGDAQGGIAVVNSDNSVDGGSSISLQTLVMSANATGGDGGFGLTDGVGGAGGDAFGGEVDAFAGAGNGSLTVAGQAFLNTDAIGGAGGDGGSGIAGGAGGTGGAAVGGTTVFGTLSRSDTGSVNTGNASFTDVLAYSAATGGTGGAGGTGSGSNGNGGDGGDATGGASILLVRGSTVTISGQVTMAADAFGGDGGSGTVQGVGGDATVGGNGGVGVAVTSRFQHPEQRGFLDAANIFGVAQAVGGAGSADGASIVADSPISIEVTNSDASADLLALYASGGAQAAVRPSFLSVTNGTADFGELSMSTPGDLSVSLDSATVNANYLYLAAGNFVLPEVRPATLGTFNVATGLEVYSNLDFLSYANFVLPFDVSFNILGSFLTGDLDVGGTFDLSVGNSITTGTLDAASVSFDAGQDITTAAITSGGAISLSSLGAVSTGDLIAGGTSPGAGAITIAADAGPVTMGSVESTGSLNVQSNGSLTVGAVDSANVFLAAGQGITSSAINSAGAIYLSSQGAITAGDLNAGGTTIGAGKIAIGSASGPVVTGALRSTGDLGIQTGGSITTGNLVGRDVLLLAGGSIGTGSIFAGSGTQANGAIYFGNSSVVSSNSNVFQQFRGPSGMLSIFQADPVAIGGAATFGGAIQGGSLTGAAQGALTAQAATVANFIQLASGGLISVNGAWRSPDIELVSNDIAIASSGSLDALSIDGSIDLASTNAAGMTVGDGAGSAGYVLDNSEFGRIKAGEIVVVGIDGQQATDMTIGNLSITGTQLYGDGGNVVFATGDRLTETPGGILRIAGAVNATGFGASNEIGLLADTVEIEAVNGSLRVSNASNQLGGLVYFEANHIHVASDAILAKLRADPLYAGRIVDLNTPLAVARPDGVLSALFLDVNPGQTLYVQNTGTAALPAGFVTGLEGNELDFSDSVEGTQIDVVINGQFVTTSGTLTGKAAFDAIVASNEGQPFDALSETSQLNGCVFSTGTCAVTVTSDPVASISSEISVVTAATLDESPSAPAADDADEGDDGSSDDNDDSDGDSGAAPIAPPAPLINTRQLNPNVNVVEPVAGAGNPALLGSAVDEGITQGETP